MKTLLYCGIGNIASFIALRPLYDIAYCFDANPHKIDYLKRIFKNDANVLAIHCYADAEGSKNVSYTLKEDKYSDANSYKKTSASLNDNEGSSVFQQINVTTNNISDFCEQHNIQEIDTLVTCLDGPRLKTFLRSMEKFINKRCIKHDFYPY